MKAIEWTEPALADMAALDKTVRVRVQQAVERLAASGGGDVVRLQGVDPPEYRLRVGDWRVRFAQDAETIQILRVKHRREAYR